ncbi:MAG: hypothetical protein K2Y02_02590, partial [Burkholderiaceae bacterium]|nr:hypothetical protein [Burkholderiaceae bacterium]
MTGLLVDTQAEPITRRWPPTSGVVIDRRGNAVDVTGTVWRLNDAMNPTVIDWDHMPIAAAQIDDGVRSYIGHLIKTAATLSVRNAFHRIRELAATPAFQEAASHDGAIPYLAFSQAKDALGKDDQWKLHDARAMYRWCVGQRFEAFNHETLALLEEWSLGGNAKGRAVRSKDPKKGPLTPMEVATIVSHLHAARLRGDMPIAEQAAIVLCLATGSNAGQYASMREEDLSPIIADGKVIGYILQVPRHKKGLDYYRDGFRKRKLDVFFGTVLQELISQNGQRPASSDNQARPLFKRERAPLHDRNDGDDWRFHISALSFTELLKAGIARLGVLGRDGEALQVNTRRFRYTLLTRMKRNGASKLAMIDAADHTDDQSIGIYWEIGSDIVDQLDRALALELAPRAQALAGIVAGEADAIRGDKKSSRRYLADRERNRLEATGTCGQNSFCNITAP